MRMTSRPNTPTGRPRSAFTLIEVLVVVAIIALLVSILLPALSRARFQAKLVACRANLHELGSAFFIYSETFKNYYPITPSASEDTYYALWKARLLKNTQILVDPASKNVVRSETLAWPVNYDWVDPERTTNRIPHLRLGSTDSDIDRVAPKGRDDATGGHSYEYNGCYNGGISTSDPYSGRHKKSSHWRLYLSQIFLVTDNDDNIYGNVGCEDAIGGGNNCPQPWDNHGAEGMSMMFGDGHAEWVKKLAGTYIDRTGNAPKTVYSKNASIDRYMIRSQQPWKYFR